MHIYIYIFIINAWTRREKKLVQMKYEPSLKITAVHMIKSSLFGQTHIGWEIQNVILPCTHSMHAFFDW